MIKRMKRLEEKILLEEPVDEGRVEFCAMDSEGNNIDCFETEIEAVEFSKDESHNVFKILKVVYERPDKNGDERELEAIEIWSSLEEGAEGKKEKDIEYIVYETDEPYKIVGIRSTKVEAESLTWDLRKKNPEVNVSFEAVEKGKYKVGSLFESIVTEDLDELGRDLGRVEFCAVDMEGNNIKCFETEEEALIFTQDEVNDVFAVFRIQYAKPDENGEEAEIDVEEVWPRLEVEPVETQLPLDAEVVSVEQDEEVVRENQRLKTIDTDAGIINMLNTMIIDVFESINRHNSVLATISSIIEEDGIFSESKDAYIKINGIVDEIVNGEHVVVGQLQKALSLISFQAPWIKEGEDKAEHQIAETEAGHALAPETEEIDEDYNKDEHLTYEDAEHLKSGDAVRHIESGKILYVMESPEDVNHIWVSTQKGSSQGKNYYYKELAKVEE